MPYAVIEDNHLVRVAVKSKRIKDFYRVEGAMWQPVGCFEEWILLEQKKS